MKKSQSLPVSLMIGSEPDLSGAPIFIALGSNLGQRERYLASARQALRQIGQLMQASGIYETVPLGPSKQKFLNQVVELRLSRFMQPLALLTELKKIEKQLGRQPRDHWQEREIDLDLLFYGSLVFWGHALQVPHTELVHRYFVLAPLAEIAPDFVHPVFGLTIAQLLNLLRLNH